MQVTQWRRMEPAEAEDYIGPEGEIIVEKNTYLIRVHDGLTPGGFATLTLAQATALFITQSDFDTEVAALTAELTTANDDALEQVIQEVIICRAPVLAISNAPPGGPSTGDRYLVAHSGLSGIFIGHPDEVVEYTSATDVVFSGTPLDGHQIFNIDDQTRYYYHEDTGTWTTVNPDVTLETRFTDIEDAVALLAPLASPTFTGVPAAPTAALDTNTTQLATTAFVLAQIAGALGGADFDNNLAMPGFQMLPGGLIIQWAQGADDAADSTQTTQVISFAIDFPNQCLACMVTKRLGSASAAADNWYDVVGDPGTSSVTVQRQHGEGGVYNGSVTRPVVLAVGY